MSFQNIMQHLHPRVIIEKVELQHDTARGSYRLQSSIARSYAEFEQVIIDYANHHMSIVLGVTMPPDMLLAKARNFLDSSCGFKEAAYIALSGSNGGLVYVLNQISEGFKQEAKRAYFDYILDSFIDPLSFEEITAVMAELKDRLGAFSPQPIAYASTAAMAADYKAILWNYIDSLTKYKNLWQY